MLPVIIFYLKKNIFFFYCSNVLNIAHVYFLYVIFMFVLELKNKNRMLKCFRCVFVGDELEQNTSS